MLRPAMFLGKLDDRSSPPESEDLATTRLPLAKICRLFTGQCPDEERP